MIEIGRLCIKIAGRDAGKTACVVDIIDENYVLIDGATRRRKCNIVHLEPLATIIKIKKGASHEEVKAELSKLKITTRESKPKEKTERPRKQRKKKVVQETEKAKSKKEAKVKESPKKVKEEVKQDSKKEQKKE